jgi:integrase
VTELEAHLERYSTNADLVFAGRDGGPLRRNNFRRRVLLPAAEASGLSPLRFHDLRHTAAGLMIAQNVHLKVIQSRLGHSSITVTMDTYGHLFRASMKRSPRDSNRPTERPEREVECTSSARPPRWRSGSVRREGAKRPIYQGS